MGEPKRIGVYGGTFDPIHRTHLEVARAALKHARLDRVIFVVAGQPPHKGSEVFASPEDRYEMTAAALDGEAAMSASRLELDRPGPSYTADTLAAMQAAYPEAELLLIVGGDSLEDLPRWREPEAITERARILAVPRPGADLSVPPMLAGRVDILPFEESALSSTGVRSAIERDEDTAAYLPSSVRAIIDAKGLYHAHP